MSQALGVSAQVAMVITPHEVLGAGDWAALTAALARGKRQRLAGCPWMETTALVVAALVATGQAGEVGRVAWEEGRLFWCTPSQRSIFTAPLLR